MGDDGRVFVQLAKWESSQAVLDMKLPAVKCRRNETSDEAVQRLVSTRLGPLAAGIELLRAERGTAEQDSNFFGVRTTYMRKLFFASLDASQSVNLALGRRTVARESSDVSQVVERRASTDL